MTELGHPGCTVPPRSHMLVRFVHPERRRPRQHTRPSLPRCRGRYRHEIAFHNSHIPPYPFVLGSIGHPHRTLRTRSIGTHRCRCVCGPRNWAHMRRLLQPLARRHPRALRRRPTHPNRSSRSSFFGALHNCRMARSPVRQAQDMQTAQHDRNRRSIHMPRSTFDLDLGRARSRRFHHLLRAHTLPQRCTVASLPNDTQRYIGGCGYRSCRTGLLQPRRESIHRWTRCTLTMAPKLRYRRSARGHRRCRRSEHRRDHRHRRRSSRGRCTSSNCPSCTAPNHRHRRWRKSGLSLHQSRRRSHCLVRHRAHLPVPAQYSWSMFDRHRPRCRRSSRFRRGVHRRLRNSRIRC